MIRKISTSEKATILAEKGILVVVADINDDKATIKKEAEELFNVSVKKVRTQIRRHHKKPAKIAYLRLESPEAVREVFTKMGVA